MAAQGEETPSSSAAAIAAPTAPAAHPEEAENPATGLIVGFDLPRAYGTGSAPAC